MKPSDIYTSGTTVSEVTFIDLKLEDDVDELDSYQGRWINLYFLKTGESYRGCKSFDTEKEAKEASKKVFSRKYKITFTTISSLHWPEIGRKAYVTERSHAIPMPMGDV